MNHSDKNISTPAQPPKEAIDHKTIHQAIIDIGDLQAQLDSLKITLYKSLNHLRQQEAS